MIRFDPGFRALLVGSSLGLAVAGCQLVWLGSDARDMAYPGGVGEEIAAGPAPAATIHAETPVSMRVSDLAGAASVSARR